MKQNLADPDVGKLLLKLSLPATIGMTITALYNVVDSIFVGKGVGVTAVSAVSLIFPIHVVMMAVALMIGAGSAAMISISLGANKEHKLSAILNTSFIFGIVTSLLIAIPIYIFRSNIIILLGGDEASSLQANQYLSIILFGTPFTIFSMINNNIIRAEGKAHIIMFSMLVAAVTNVILDAIFIFVFAMGIKGVAYATVIAQAISVAFQIGYYQWGNSQLREYFNLREYSLKISKRILQIGSSSFVRHLTGSILFIIMNKLASIYGGYLAVAAVGINNRLVTLIFLPVVGIGQGLQPIVGYQYGARKFDLVLKTLKKATISSTVIITIFSAIVFIFPRLFIQLFTNDKELIELASYSLRFFVSMMPFIGLQIVGASFYQATGKALPALILTLTRQILILIPLLYLLTPKLGLNGIWYSIPIADFSAAILTIILLVREVQNFKKRILI